MDFPFMLKINNKTFPTRKILAVSFSCSILAFIFIFHRIYHEVFACHFFRQKAVSLSLEDKEWEVHDKPFAYYILTESCLPDVLTTKYALADHNRIDAYVLSYMGECLLNSHSHIHYHYQNNASWSAGRNFLYFKVKKSRRRYKYHIFMDDDVNLLYTDHLSDYSAKTTRQRGTPSFLDEYMKDPAGFGQGIIETKDGKSSWRAFEDDLLKHSPAFATVNYIRPDGFESQLTQDFYWQKMCGSRRKMPLITITYYMDQFFIAFHERALPLLLPYDEMYDQINWSISAIFQLFRARAILPRQNICNHRITGVNQQHRFYVHDEVPDDVLLQYIKHHAPELSFLIEDEYLNYKDFKKWKTYEKVFFADPTICLNPIKFPPTEHYRINESS